ncbi:aminopeptidase N-like [Cylas formicarius]|uniref:aminopeptidase N-like n=1 Tax=Cylas formicarius TaxID=197179 RepID=UPI0029583BD5|nr:aminopeptidase N-like [Cylas formicarius]
MDFYAYVVFLALFPKKSFSDDNVKTQSYDIYMALGKDSFEPLMDNTPQYNGSVGIIFTVIEDAPSVKLKSNAKLLTIKNVTIDGTLLDESQYTVNEADQSVTVQHEFHKNTEYNISIIYTGLMQEETEDVPFGIKQNNFQGKLFYVWAVFVDVQDMMPFFERKKHRIIANITIVHPRGHKVFGNTAVMSETELEGDMVESKLSPSPPAQFPSISFIVSNIFRCEDAQPVNGIPIRVCSRENVMRDSSWALKYIPQIVSLLERFMNNSLAMHTNFNKLDLIALPGQYNVLSFWGLLTWAEYLLLPDLKRETERQFGTGGFAHELCHQWIGELVTPSNHIFEGFCAFMQYFIPSQINDLSDWKYISYMIPEIHEGLNIDADKDTQALAEPVGKLLIYRKGAPLFRMIQHAMGHDNFEKAMQKYVMKVAYTPTSDSDLWTAFQENVDNSISKIPDGVDFASIVSSWFGQPGYPVVKATRVGNDLMISQERFVRFSEDTTTKWYIPITYTTSSNIQNFEKTEPMLWLSPSEESAIIPLDSSDSWVILNNQQTGFYRVMYDDLLLENISKALQQPNFDGISEINRAQIVDDLFAFAESKKTKYSMIFEVLDYLKNEVDFLPWTATFTAFTAIFENFSRHEVMLRYKMRVHLVCLLEKLYAAVPINAPIPNDNQYYARNQAMVGKWACGLGYAPCIEDARPFFQDYNEGTFINPHVGTEAVCNVIRFSANESYFQYLLDEYKSDTVTEWWQEQLIIQMTCVPDINKIQLMLNWTLSNSSVLESTSHAVTIYSKLSKGSEEHFEQVLQFFLKNMDTILSTFGSILYMLVIRLTERFPDKDNFDQMEAWKTIPTSDTFFLDVIASFLDSNRHKLEWIKWHKDDFYSYYDLIPDSGN